MPRFRPIDYRILAAVFEKNGFVLDRRRGDHLIYVKAGVRRPVVIPMYKSVPVFIIRNNLKDAGISRDEYFKLIGQ